MKKFHHKKDLPVEESPLTLQLQRRHTVVEGDKEKGPVVTKPRPVSRSNSTSSIYRPPKSAKDLSSHTGYLESTLSADSSRSSAASTVVITECQLSSSWLYNNKKAQMCSKENLSTGDSSSQQASDNEAKSPIVSRSKVKSVSSPERRPKRCSSCCCYAAIVVLAGLAVMGIISAIGGIIYMEFFSGANTTQTGELEQDHFRSKDSSYIKKVGPSLGDKEGSQARDLISEASLPESKKEMEVVNHFHIENKQGKVSGTILRVKKKKDVPTTDSDASMLSLRVVNESQLQEESDEEQNVKKANVPSSDAKSNSPYSKLFDLYKNIHNNLLRIPSLLEEHTRPEVVDVDSKIPEFEEVVSDSESKPSENAHQDKIESDKHSEIAHQDEIESDKHSEIAHQDEIESDKHSEIAHQDEIESDKHSEIAHQDEIASDKHSEIAHQDEIESDKHLKILDDVPLDTKDFSNQSLKQDLALNAEANNAPKEVSQPPISKYFFQRPTRDPDLAFRNMFDISERGDVEDLEDTFKTSQLSNLNGNSNGNAPIESGISNQFASANSKEFDTDLNTKSIPSGEVSGPAIPRNFFRMPSKDSEPAFRNMFDVNEESDVNHSDESPMSRFLPHVPEISDLDDAGKKESIASNLDANDKELPLELNRPVSGIAVPGPLDLLRRFSMGTEADSKDNKKTEQHDRRFFLAQALERLRTLDVRNILPSSRKKNDSKKNPKQKLEPKIQSEQEVVTERSSYLQKLRRHFFEQ